MSKINPSPRPLSGGAYAAKNGQLEQIQEPTAPPVGKSKQKALDAAKAAKKTKAGNAPAAADSAG